MRILDVMSCIGLILGLICLISELIDYIKDKRSE